MEYVILGFLMIRDLSQYDLLNALKEKVSPFYQASLGSVQSALKKLEKNGYISLNKTVVNGRSKNIYTITVEGKSYFKVFMLGDIDDHKFEAQTSTRLFFMGSISLDNRKFVVDKVIDYLEITINAYVEGEQLYNRKVIPVALKEMATYQFKTLNLGIHNLRSSLKWFEEFRQELEAYYE